MVAEALEVATDPDFKFELAIQLGRLEVAKVSGACYCKLIMTFVCFVAGVYQRIHVLS